MKKETYFVYLKKSISFFMGSVLEIKCDGMSDHPGRIYFYNNNDSEEKKIIAGFERSEIVGWQKK